MTQRNKSHINHIKTSCLFVCFVKTWPDNVRSVQQYYKNNTATGLYNLKSTCSLRVLTLLLIREDGLEQD